MPQKTIVDAGPIVAYLTHDDNHDWAVRQFSRFPYFETCEPVLAEACARLVYAGFDQAAAIRLVHRGVVRLSFDASANIGRILQLMEKYRDQPMDFADACLVVMSEESPDSLVLTLDSDFKVYRRSGRDIIPTLTP
ncbi:MAG: PIN domain-containing protein [Limisphaerales bacterium]